MGRTVITQGAETDEPNRLKAAVRTVGVTAILLAVSALALAPAVAFAQAGLPAAAAPAAPAAQVQPPSAPKDPLDRDTPRGTLMGFMRAARAGNLEVASQYMARGEPDETVTELAHQLHVVLDSRLPARLNDLSDRPEGALANPLKPDQDVIATIDTRDGPLDLVVERADEGPAGRIWLFSRRTLDAIPNVFDEVEPVSIDRLLPRNLPRIRLGGVRLYQWLALVVVVPLIYRLLGLLNPLLGLLMAPWRKRDGAIRPPVHIPGFARLLLLAFAIRWLIAGLELPFMERRFWSVNTTLIIIAGVVWMLLLLTAAGERYLHRHLGNTGELTALLRLARRTAEVVVVSSGVLVTLSYFGVDPTAALAGLGIGGIAVALAAQKTLENVIGGLSIIFDKAVRVGDFLRLGDTVGSVDYIGLRSTRIRTLDRTILSVPNGQIANVNIETLSARDKFWFHHTVALRYETTSDVMRAVIDGIRSHLVAHPAVDVIEPIRARLFRLGPFSLDIDVFAYIRAGDWDRFLEIQQELLLAIMAIVERAGASLALPTQTLHLSESASRILPEGLTGPARITRVQGDTAEPA